MLTQLAYGTISAATSAVLIVSALEKLRTREAFIGALHSLGFAKRRTWWVLACATEFVIALYLVVGESALLAATSVSGLGIAFALAGLQAIRKRRRISCLCFGNLRPSALGTPQFIALPFWLVSSAVVYTWRPTTDHSHAALAAGVIAVVAVFYCHQLVKVTIDARNDRLALLIGQPGPRQRA